MGGRPISLSREKYFLVNKNLNILKSHYIYILKEYKYSYRLSLSEETSLSINLFLLSIRIKFYSDLGTSPFFFDEKKKWRISPKIALLSQFKRSPNESKIDKILQFIKILFLQLKQKANR